MFVPQCVTALCPLQTFRSGLWPLLSPEKPSSVLLHSGPEAADHLSLIGRSACRVHCYFPLPELKTAATTVQLSTGSQDTQHTHHSHRQVSSRLIKIKTPTTDVGDTTNGHEAHFSVVLVYLFCTNR